MASNNSHTDQVRRWYSEPVTNHDDRGEPGYEPKVDHRRTSEGGPAVIKAFPKAGGGFYNEPVHARTGELWDAYIALMKRYGVAMPSAGGVDAVRNIGDTDWPSLHCYLVAVDLPPNSYKPAEFIEAIEAIRTKSGAQAFRNLDGDRMHDEVTCSPADVDSGVDWATVEGVTPASTYRGVADCPISGGKVLPWVRDVIDWGIEVGMINVEDDTPESWKKDLTDGRYWTFEYRRRQR